MYLSQLSKSCGVPSSLDRSLDLIVSVTRVSRVSKSVSIALSEGLRRVLAQWTIFFSETQTPIGNPLEKRRLRKFEDWFRTLRGTFNHGELKAWF